MAPHAHKIYHIYPKENSVRHLKNLFHKENMKHFADLAFKNHPNIERNQSLLLLWDITVKHLIHFLMY
jgi:hypothetical protein